MSTHLRAGDGRSMGKRWGTWAIMGWSEYPNKAIRSLSFQKCGGLTLKTGIVGTDIVSVDIALSAEGRSRVRERRGVASGQYQVAEVVRSWTVGGGGDGKVGVGGHGSPRHRGSQPGRQVRGLDGTGEAGHGVVVVCRCLRLVSLMRCCLAD